MQHAKDMIRERFGLKGMKIFSLINGRRTVGQIMRSAKVDEEYILDFMEFLRERGIISLKHKQESGRAMHQHVKHKSKRLRNKHISRAACKGSGKRTTLKAKTKKR